MGIEIRLLDDDGEELEVLPDVESFNLSPVLSDAGAVEFSYPRDGKNWNALADRDEFRITVYLDGVRRPQLDAWVQEVNGDDISDAPWKFTGHFNNGRLAEAVVYPKNWPTVDPLDVKQRFATATPGTIVRTLIQQAQARGTLTEITMGTFSATHDSNGDPWEMALTVEYAPQLDYLEIMRNMYAQRVAEFEMVGDDLRLYNFEANAQDLTLGTSPVVFRKGRDLRDSPRKRSTRDLGTVMLAAGTEGLYLERVDAPGIASRRRIERAASQGQVADLGTLTAYADAELDKIKSAKMEKTHGLSFSDDSATNPSPRPVRDFNVGDWAYSDMGSGLERLRIKQWVLRLDNSGELSGSVSLNDLFAEQNEVLTRRIEGIVGGSTITGGSQAVEVVPEELVDGLAPHAPVAPVLASAAYMDDQGHTFAQISASWLAVTTNADNTAIEDLEGYRIRWQQAGQTDWQYVDVGNVTQTSWSPVAPAVTHNVQVQAYDRAGNASAWSANTAIFTGADATPPEQPSAPIVDNYIGLLRYRWDGNTQSGAPLAPDFSHIEVHTNISPTFTPDATTLWDNLVAADGVGFAQPLYGVTLYVKFVAVDYTGNKSTPSVATGGVTNQVLSADIFTGAVGTAKLANLAVVNAKIADLAVNDAKISDLSVAKLTAGIILAQVTISGRIATALTGARREMNGVGFQGWDASGNLVINLDGVNNLLTGIFKTAVTGRRIEIGAAGAVGEINFYAPSGTQSFIKAYTEAGGVEAIQFGILVSGAGNNWNRINYNSSANGEYATYRSGTHEFSYDTVTPNEEGRFVVFAYPSKGTGTAQLRFQMNSTGTKFWWDATQALTFFCGNNGSAPDEGFIDITRHGVADSRLRSPKMKFASEETGGGSYYGAHFKYVVDWSGSVASNARMECTNVVESGYEAIWAAAFTQSSSQVGKTDVETLPPGNLAKTMKLRAVSWLHKDLPKVTIKNRGTRKEKMTVTNQTGDRRRGMIAEEVAEIAPELVVGEAEAIDHGAWLALLTASMQELNEALKTELAAVRAELADLKGKK